MQSIRRRNILMGSFGIAAGAAHTAQAQSFPDRPLQLIVPFAPGGPTDALARLVGKDLGERLGKPVVVVPKPGAAGNIGSEFVARAAPDGHTLVLSSLGTHGINASLYRTMPYDTLADFSSIATVAQTAHVVLVHPSLPVGTLAELITYAKARPGQIQYGSAGHGSAAHLAVELLQLAAGIRMDHIPYRGGGQAVVDLLSGRIQLMMPTTLLGLDHVRANALKALAVTSPARDPSLPAVPSVVEIGYGEVAMVGWFGLSGPARMPSEIVARLSSEMGTILEAPATSEKLAGLGMTPLFETPEQMTARIAADVGKWARIVKAAGIEQQ
jgi:tripartite-type tricarboxylate transporter receptor subunit TctC